MVILEKVESADPGIYTILLTRGGIMGALALTVEYRQPVYRRRGGRESSSWTAKANGSFQRFLDEALALFPAAEVHLLMLDGNTHISESASGLEGWSRTPPPGCTTTDSRTDGACCTDQRNLVPDHQLPTRPSLTEPDPYQAFFRTDQRDLVSDHQFRFSYRPDHQ